jgi:hypothetical protein
VAVGSSVPHRRVGGEQAGRVGGAGLEELGRFRAELSGCLTARADALFELADAVLCPEGPVRSARTRRTTQQRQAEVKRQA